MFTLKSVIAFVVSLLVAEATYLYGANITTLKQITFAVVLQMIILSGTVILPWLGYSPKETPIGAPAKP